MTSQINIIKITRNDEKRWNNLLSNAVNPSYKQSITYEYVREYYGREINTFIFEKDGVDIAGAHYSIKRSQANLITIADVLSGYVFRKEPNAEILSFLLDHFINWANHRKTSYARFMPWLPKSIAGNETSYTPWFGNEMKRAGFKPIKQGLHTYWIDLTLSEEQILGKMRPQTRSKVRKGLKSAILTERYNKPNHELIEIFWTFYNKLGKRKGFNTLSESRFKKEVTSLLKTGLASLFVIRFKGQVVNVALASNFGQSTYFHGALTPEYKHLYGCPSIGHLAQWEIIKYMKSLGLKTYDMAFCPGPIPIKSHPSFDMWRFKYGFGGDHVEFLQSYGKILQPIRGKLFQYLKYRR